MAKHEFLSLLHYQIILLCCCKSIRVEQVRLLDQFVELTTTLDKLCWRVELRDAPFVQHDDPI